MILLPAVQPHAPRAAHLPLRGDGRGAARPVQGGELGAAVGEDRRPRAQGGADVRRDPAVG